MNKIANETACEEQKTNISKARRVIAGTGPFVSKAALDLNEAEQKNSEAENYNIRIEENDFFPHAPRFSPLTVEDESWILIETKETNPEAITECLKILKLRNKWIDKNQILIKAIHDATETYSKSWANLAKPIYEENIDLLNKTCKGFVLSLFTKELQYNNNVSETFKGKIKNGIAFEQLDKFERIEIRRFIVADNAYCINENTNLDKYVGNDFTRLIFETLSDLEKCFKNPTETCLKSCAQKIYQVVAGKFPELEPNCASSVMYA